MANKSPAFLFYPNDYLGGTLGMSLEEKGAIIELLVLQFNRGHMDDKMIKNAVGNVWKRVSHKFVQDSEGLYFSKRLEYEMNRRNDFVSSRKNNLKGKVSKKLRGKNDHMGAHTSPHMEKEIENDKDNKKKEIDDSSSEKQDYNQSTMNPGQPSEFENEQVGWWYKRHKKMWKSVETLSRDELLKEIRVLLQLITEDELLIIQRQLEIDDFWRDKISTPKQLMDRRDSDEQNPMFWERILKKANSIVHPKDLDELRKEWGLDSENRN